MKIYSILRNNEVVTTIELPSTMSEITVRKLVDYDVQFEAMPQWFQDYIAKGGELSKNETAQFITYSCKLLSLFTGENINVLLQSDDPTLLIQIWQSLHRTIQTYAPKAIKSFEYKGQTFIVPHQIINNLTGASENPNLTTSEVITALQYEFLLNDTELIKQGRNYERYLALVSIFCRLENETFNMTDDEITKFITKRIKHFSELTADVALDVVFFFINSLTQSKKTDFVNSLLKILQRKK